jgi:beta-N-acetylhexosaminidase
MNQILELAAAKTVVAAIGSPYVAVNFPTIQNYLCTFSSVPSSEISAVKALFGELKPQGRLPVSLPGIASRGFSLQNGAKSGG